MMGEVIQINTKSNVEGESGLPKIAIDGTIEIHKTGVGDDYNNYRAERLNNTNDRAVLIYTTDKLKELQNEGWSVKAGDLGENLTLEGVEYKKFNVGTSIIIGDEVKLRVTEICNPCNNLADLPYVGEEKIKEFIKTMKGRRGWYCEVLEEGKVESGDTFKILNE